MDQLTQSIKRWKSIGPYYAMFPSDFAYEVVNKYSKSGECVLDPFAGRATSIYAGALSERPGIGIEINPVGWVYATAKLHPGEQAKVEAKLKKIIESSKNTPLSIDALPEFFYHCYSPDVLRFLLATKSMLNWKRIKEDTTLMAIILVYLHGKIGQSLSNQMQQTKAMGPNYSIQWWKKNGFTPPDIDPYDFLVKRIKWRYEKGLPKLTDSEVILGDSIKVLKHLQSSIKNKKQKKFSLLFTSPPYYGLTNYHVDQWLRLWMLGGPDKPINNAGEYKDRFNSKESYLNLLDTVFKYSSYLMEDKYCIYVRTDAREFTFENTLTTLRKHFPNSKEKIIQRPLLKKSQTSVFGNKSNKPGEIDIVLTN